MSIYPAPAVERAMKRQEIILRAMSGELTWIQAADILGVSCRSLRRWRYAWQRAGYEGLFDRRTRRPSPRRAPVEEVERILTLYRDRYAGFNVRHFHDLVTTQHQVTLSYSFVKKALQEAGLVRKGKAKGRHRKRRPRRACFGEMLHIDGSLHPWLALVPDQKQSLIAVLDDATSRLLYAQLWPAESTEAVLRALYEVIDTYGIPHSLYSDRASWAFLTPQAGGPVDPDRLTKVGAVLARLGVEHIASYSPQGRGRSERMHATLQGRLVNELRAAGIRTLEDANRYLREVFLPRHNQRFAQAPADAASGFVAVASWELERAFAEPAQRSVAKDNTVRVHGRVLQLDQQPGRVSCAGLKVTVLHHRTGHYSVWRGCQLYGCFDAEGDPIPLEDAVGGTLASAYGLRSRAA